MTNIRLELGINAQQFIQQVHLHNEVIEAQIEAGINQALDEVLKGDNFTNKIKEAMMTELYSIIQKEIFSWEMKSKIHKAIEESIGSKIEDFAEKIAEKVAEDFKI